MLHDDKFITSLADRVNKSLNTTLEKSRELIEKAENKLQKI